MQFDKYVDEFKIKNYSNFDEFYKLTSRQVYFIVLGITKDEMLADDILQDTYLSFLKNIDNIDPKGNVLSYLVTIAKNKCLDVFKKENRVIHDEKIIERQEDNKDDTKIKEILSLLDDEEEREIIIYHVIFNYRFREISKIMNKPLGTILWKYNKAIKCLKERMVNIYEN